LSPFFGIYALVIYLRNLAYKNRWFRSSKFDIPVICVGNLTTGGTGKTPHTEYLINLLKEDYTIGVLSRGYGRKTSGFKEVQRQSTASEVGDEPLLYKLKNPNIKICVSEDRALGIPAMATDDMCVLLDDAFQHRAVKAGISILLTEYDNLFTRDELLPVGNLREFKSASERADLIVVTKAPKDISTEEKQKIIAEINPKPYQYVFFSYIEYQPMYRLFSENTTIENKKETEVLLLSGIANPSKMEDELKAKFKQVYTRKFRDHHVYTRKDIESIIETYNNLGDTLKVIITTEKDVTRLLPFRETFIKNQIPIYSLPIKVNFATEDKIRFDKAIRLYIDKTLKIEELVEE
ncbi:MAG: tetraacyldisaccharide 4'-kinase, partial [Chitinophagales bacterium]